jgi:hypothetical protein
VHNLKPPTVGGFFFCPLAQYFYSQSTWSAVFVSFTANDDVAQFCHSRLDGRVVHHSAISTTRVPDCGRPSIAPGLAALQRVKDVVADNLSGTRCVGIQRKVGGQSKVGGGLRK